MVLGGVHRVQARREHKPLFPKDKAILLNCLGLLNIYTIIRYYNAIQSIKIINRQLDDLIANIEGTAIETTANNEKINVMPSLVSVLNEGPFMIKEFVDKANEQIMMINALLFQR